ncbi:hypothetical protein CFC21_051273 [Triticum aestivum]|uniref:Uncharacterized protein n=2 Tax=Triticum aestivum TaxID=4565 RepID=A0A9R1K5C1_WHEAT|nr:hypothetical protein CFC21_051273 [Triticum aestivum]
MPRRFTVLVDWASCVAFYWLVVADIPKRKLTREGKEGLCTHEPHLLHPYTQPLPLLRIFCQGPLWLQQRAVKGASRMGPADFFAGSGAQGRRRRARSHANVVASREEWVGGEGGGGSRARVGSSRLIHGVSGYGFWYRFPFLIQVLAEVSYRIGVLTLSQRIYFYQSLEKSSNHKLEPDLLSSLQTPVHAKIRT